MAMHKNRLLFRKVGRAVYLSHLDLMATFQRAFLRSGVKVWQTEGFNRHVYVSIALPLSVGYESECEILEFNLEDELPLARVTQRLNAALPEGVEVLRCYEAKVPLKRIGELDWELTLEYDRGVPEGAREAFAAFLGQEHCVIRKPSKKAKRGYTELDLIPLVRAWTLERREGALAVRARLAAQNPGLNPSLLVDALAQAYPALRPDFVRYRRREVYDASGEVFR